eukprot:g3363.t1
MTWGEMCDVEIALDFLPDSKPLTVDVNRTDGAAVRRRLGGSRVNLDRPVLVRRTSPGALNRLPSAGGRRRLQSTTVEIQVLVLYSDQALVMVGVSDVMMESMVSASFADVNEAFDNSEIGILITIVHQTSLPYEEGSSDSGDKLDTLRENVEVQALRNEYGADLVLLVGELHDVCGIAYILSNPLSWHGDWAYALVNPNCFSNLVIAHEFGHNLGCDHNREHAGEDQGYAHGYRYCSGTGMYTTIMSYTAGCTATRANYFANPDVMYLDRPTGTETENCARAIEENKDVVSNFRDAGDEWEEESDGVDFGDLLARAGKWLVFVPIGLAFYFLKRSESYPRVGWDSSAKSSSSSDDALSSTKNSTSSSASTNSSSSSSPSAVYAIDTVFTNSSGDPNPTNASSPTNVSAVEGELIEAIEVDQQTLVVNRTSYSVTGGASFTGGMARRTWIGTVTEPAQAEDEAFPRRVSMTWGEVCDVEVALEFLPDGPPLRVGLPGERRLGANRARPDGQTPLERAPSRAVTRRPSADERRRLQSETVEIQALVLYSDQALDMVSVSDVQMESMVSASFADVNEAFDNSEIGILITIVHQTTLPYVEGNGGSGDKLDYMRQNSEVGALRDEYGADLVLLVGELYDVCGIAYTTIMSYTAGCTATRANYFANPDVSYLNRPTGTETENCARAIEQNKEVISNFRDQISDGERNDDDDDFWGSEDSGAVSAVPQAWITLLAVGIALEALAHKSSYSLPDV